MKATMLGFGFPLIVTLNAGFLGLGVRGEHSCRCAGVVTHRSMAR